MSSRPLAPLGLLSSLLGLCSLSLAVALSLAIALGVCACNNEPRPVERTKPWRAPAAASATSANVEKTLAYTLAPRQHIAFSLKTHSTTITGVFPVVRGTLDLDAVNLKNSDANLRVDLGAVRITSGDEDENRRYSVWAQNWLNLGASIPEAARENRRWATVLLEEIQEIDAGAAHEARIDRKRLEQLKSMSQAQHAGASTTVADATADSDAGTDAEANALDDAGLPAEVRVARARVRSSLELNNRRVTQPYAVSVELHYPASATPGFPPDRVVVASAGSYKVALDQYQIAPRNAAGMLVASDLKLLGSEVARSAQLQFALEFVPATPKAPR